MKTLFFPQHLKPRPGRGGRSSTATCTVHGAYRTKYPTLLCTSSWFGLFCRSADPAASKCLKSIIGVPWSSLCNLSSMVLIRGFELIVILWEQMPRHGGWIAAKPTQSCAVGCREHSLSCSAFDIIVILCTSPCHACLDLCLDMK